ncbi:MAG: aminotransferase class V-fold PLP-dependent enzyme, partial [Pirellulaceae bacterium]|nr:aminotransferase class V-fold PLP-dependent enzyme [Pirellulaceae bacterium]
MKQQIDTAVILAAGMGTRLRSVVTERPKAFLSFGCKPIIAESIERLERAGVRRIILVTGYLREYFDDLAAARGNVEVVHNPDYADSGSMYSLACAGHLIDGDLLLLESDLVYEQRALDAVLESPADDCILLSGRTDAGDEVYVSGDDQRIGRMSKDRTSLNAPVIGELVGISRISKPLFDRMMKCASEMFHESLHVAYETDCLVAAAQQVAVGYRVVDDLLWGEVDDESQYLRVRDNVYPQISRQEKSMADTAGVERKVLLNPGPATTSDTVKLAQVVPDICPREDEFVRVLSDVRRDLCQIVNGSPEHTCVLFGGSGTAAVDATLNSVVPSGGKLLILNNGAYGNRMRQIAEAYRLPHEEMKFASTQAIDVSAVDRVLHGDRSISHVACVHHETTTGLLNPLPEILNAVHGHG